MTDLRTTKDAGDQAIVMSLHRLPTGARYRFSCAHAVHHRAALPLLPIATFAPKTTLGPAAAWTSPRRGLTSLGSLHGGTAERWLGAADKQHQQPDPRHRPQHPDETDHDIVGHIESGTVGGRTHRGRRSEQHQQPEQTRPIHPSQKPKPQRPPGYQYGASNCQTDRTPPQAGSANWAAISA
jgi:hypothetical protein